LAAQELKGAPPVHASFIASISSLWDIFLIKKPSAPADTVLKTRSSLSSLLKAIIVVSLFLLFIFDIDDIAISKQMSISKRIRFDELPQ